MRWEVARGWPEERAIVMSGRVWLCRSGSGRGGSQIVGDGDQIEVEGVCRKAGIAHAGETVSALELREGALDGLTDAPDQLVAHRLPVRQRFLAPNAPVLDAVLDAARSQGFAPGSLLIGLVGVDRALVALDQRIGHLALIGLGACQPAPADQARAPINGKMGLVAEKELPLLAGPRPVGVGIVSRAALFAGNRRARGRRVPRTAYQRRIDQRPRLQHEAGPLELPENFLEQPLSRPACFSALRNRQSVVSSGVGASSASPQKRRNDTRSSSASSNPGSDNPYHCASSSALNIDTGS